MVPMCWGGVAGYGTHVLGWSRLAMVPTCWGGVYSWLWYGVQGCMGSGLFEGRGVGGGGGGGGGG